MPPDHDGLRAGCALLAASRFAAARVAFARAGDPADPLVVGLVDAAAAFDAAARGDPSRRPAARARRRLDAAVGPVETAPLRAALAAPGPDAAGPPRLRVAGDRVDPEALSPTALGLAARAVAATTGLDESLVGDAARYAAAEAEAGRGRYATLLTDVVVGREPGLAVSRLRSLVERRRARERDVDGLF